jgi:hypothetical protein
MLPFDLVLALPGLVPGAGASPATLPGMPALARLLAAAGETVVERDGVHAALAPFYGVARQSDWPFAPLALAALGHDPGDSYWLAATPVMLVAGRDDVRLAHAVDDLDAGEADALAALLNAHFAADGLVFVAPLPGRWFVRAPSVQRITTHPLDVVVGRTLRALLPEGPDAGRWRRWQSEIQMLLHEHPVNVARADEARPAANSVWFWGGGTYPPPARTAVRTFAHGDLVQALAAHAGEPAQPLPRDLDLALANSHASERVVIAFDAPLDLDAIERSWAAPAWSALARGRAASVTLVAGGDDAAAVSTTRRPGAWQRLAARVRTPDLAAQLARVRGSR